MTNLPMDELENELPLVYNAFVNWTESCMSSADLIGIGFLDILVLQILCQSGRQKRLVDICFILKVEDQHTVNYSLKKLIKKGLVESEKKAKILLYKNTDKGQESFSKFKHRRYHCMEHLLTKSNKQVEEVFGNGERLRSLQALGDLYDHAARLANFI